MPNYVNSNTYCILFSKKHKKSVIKHLLLLLHLIYNICAHGTEGYSTSFIIFFHVVSDRMYRLGVLECTALFSILQARF